MRFLLTVCAGALLLLERRPRKRVRNLFNITPLQENYYLERRCSTPPGFWGVGCKGKQRVGPQQICQFADSSCRESVGMTVK